MLWANLHLLFWLSLFPFATGWMGENHFTAAAHRALRRGAADGRDRVLHAAADDHPRAGARLDPEESRWARLEGQAVAGALYAAIVATRFAVDRAGDLRGRGVDLADSGPAHRKRPATQLDLKIKNNRYPQITQITQSSKP